MDTVLQVSDLRKDYPGGRTAVNGIDFMVEAGEIVGILGPNGSGKTTTLKSITGLTRADSGQVLLNGRDLAKDRRRALADMGTVLEGARNVYWRLTPIENIMYFAGLKGLPRPRALARASELVERLSLEEYQDQQLRMLSRGNQQKVAVACALVHEPALILLDEPTLGLDVEMVRGMKTWLRELVDRQKSAMVITSHDIHFIEALCDRVVILYQGELISENTVSELRSRYAPRKTLNLTVHGRVDLTLQTRLVEFGWQVVRQPNASLLTLETSNLNVLNESLRLLGTHDHALLDIDVAQENLEDIFLRVVNRSEAENQVTEVQACVL